MIKNLEREKYLSVYGQSSCMKRNGEVYEIYQ